MRKSYNFLGTQVCGLTYSDLYSAVDSWISNKNSRSHNISIINSYCATLAFQDAPLAKIYDRSDLIAPDGMPFVYWIRLFLRVPCVQFDGSSILTQLAQRAKEKNYTFFLYGGDPDVVKNMKEKVETQYPFIRIVGAISPPFRPLTKEEDEDVCRQINQLKPDIILVGLGTPKQDYWIDEHIYKIRGAVMINCGALFDFLGGRIKRAPRIITILCLEWLYRLLSKDFKRLWRRYTILNVIFVWNFFLQITGLRVVKRELLKRTE